MSHIPAYSQSARIYDSIYDFKDFPATTTRLRQLIRQHSTEARSLLDVGCGTGRHLELLGSEYERTGTDLSEEMLQVARLRCPDVPFHAEDMAVLTLDQTFDVVTCLFSAIAYVRTAERMFAAISSMAHHLKPGGLLLVEPWLYPHQYWVGHLVANHTSADHLEVSWMYLQELAGGCSRFDINYLVGSEVGITHYVERHEMGLFTHEEYMAAFLAADLQPGYDADGLFGRGLYSAVKMA